MHALLCARGSRFAGKPQALHERNTTIFNQEEPPDQYF
jgi:hypothetical protein